MHVDLAGYPRRQEQHDDRQQCLPPPFERPACAEQDRGPEEESQDRDRGLSRMSDEERARDVEVRAARRAGKPDPDDDDEEQHDPVRVEAERRDRPVPEIVNRCIIRLNPTGKTSIRQ